MHTYQRHLGGKILDYRHQCRSHLRAQPVKTGHDRHRLLSQQSRGCNLQQPTDIQTSRLDPIDRRLRGLRQGGLNHPVDGPFRKQRLGADHQHQTPEGRLLSHAVHYASHP